MDLLQNQVRAFSPNSSQVSVNESQFKKLIDIDDDGDIDLFDIGVIAGIGVLGFYVISFLKRKF